MRHLLHISLLLVLLSVAVSGCRQTASEAERRLIALDSLIATAPDSALTQLSATDTTTLSEPERAYLALLLTQAMYKAYIPATSDTLIGRAWRYYEHSGPYDRRVRALLYQGTVAEELGRPEQAMRWYKQAEDYARPDDYFNLGYILYRQASLLKLSFLIPDKSVVRAKKALPYLEKSGNKYYHLSCLHLIGEAYRMVNHDSSLVYLRRAGTMATEMGDSMMVIRNQVTIVGLHYEMKEWAKASSLAREILNLPGQSHNLDCCFFGVMAYCHQNKLDSAKSILDLFEGVEPHNRRDSVILFRVRAEYARCSGDIMTYRDNDSLCNIAADSAYLASRLLDVLQVDLETSTLQHDVKQLSFTQKVFASLACVLIVLLIVFMVFYVIKRRANKRSMQALEAAYSQLSNSYEKLKLKRDSRMTLLKSADSLAMQTTCIEMILQKLTFSGVKGISIVKQIDQLSDQIEDKEKRFRLRKIELGEEFWQILEQFMMSNYPATMKRIHDGDIKMNDNEIKLMSLDCLHVPNAVIAIITDYGEHSVASIKHRIVQKLGGVGGNIPSSLQKLESE